MRKKPISSVTLNASRLIVTVSAVALTGSALAGGAATMDFYRSLVPGQQAQQLPEECYDALGQLVITAENVDLCSALPTAAIGAPGLAGGDYENGSDKGDDDDDDSFRGDDDVVGDDDEGDDDTGDDEGDDDVGRPGGGHGHHEGDHTPGHHGEGHGQGHQH